MNLTMMYSAVLGANVFKLALRKPQISVIKHTIVFYRVSGKLKKIKNISRKPP